MWVNNSMNGLLRLLIIEEHLQELSQYSLATKYNSESKYCIRVCFSVILT